MRTKVAPILVLALLVAASLLTFSPPAAAKSTPVVSTGTTRDVSPNNYIKNLLVLPGRNPDGEIVLFDQYHQEYWDTNRLAEFIELLQNKSYTVIINNQEFTDDLLAAVDILIIPDPEEDFTIYEQQAVHNFLADNGSLYLMGNFYTYLNQELYNNLTETYGIYWNASRVYDPDTTYPGTTYPLIHTWGTGPIATQLTTGVGYVLYPYGTTLVVSSPAEVIGMGDANTYAVNSTGATIATGSECVAFAAVDLNPGGRIFASGSTSYVGYDRIYYNDTLTFVNNTLNWLEGEVKQKPEASIFITEFGVEPGTIAYGETATITLKIQNFGAGNALGVTVSLVLPTNCELVSGSTTVDVGTLGPLAVEEITWTVRGIEPGVGTIRVVVDSDNAGTRESEVELEVVPALALYPALEPAAVNVQTQTWTTLRVNVSNVASYTATDVTVEITLPSGLTARQPTTVELGAMDPGENRSVAWTIDIHTTGIFEIGIDVTSTNASTNSAVVTLFAVTEKVIVFDQAHGQYYDAARMSAFIDFLEEYGMPIVINNGTISETMLDATALLIIPNPKVEFTTDEIQAIKDFVNEGGSLLVTGDWYRYVFPEILNPITEDFGITWWKGDVYDDDDNLGAPYYPIIYTFATNTIADILTRGVESIYYSGTALNITGGVSPIVLGNDDFPNATYALEQAEDGTILSVIGNGTEVVLVAAVELPNGGRVVASGSSALFGRTDFFEHNKPFITNVMSWLLRALKLDVSVVVPAAAYANTEFEVTATIKNTGIANITGVNVTLTLSSGLTLVEGSTFVDLGTLEPGETETITWKLVASAEGTYSIEITVKSENYDVVTRQASITVLPPTTVPPMLALLAVLAAVPLLKARRRK